MEDIAKIILAFIGGGGMKYVYDYYKKRLEYKKESSIDRFHKTFENVHEVYKCLNQLAYHSKAGRAIIVKVEDGGGRPSANSHIHSTVLYEVFDSPLTSIKQYWQNVKVGEIYIKYVKEIYDNGRAEYLVDGLKPSDLKDLHVEHGTKYVESVFLMKTERYFLYLSVQYAEDAPEIDSTARNSLRYNKQKLLDIFEQDEDEGLFFN